MYFLVFLCTTFATTKALPFFDTSLRSCPNIQAQRGLQARDYLGTWRLGYLYLDSTETLEEEENCVVTEIRPVNETHLNLELFIDSRQPGHIDRSTAEFPVTLLTPGEWAVHTPLAHTEYVHATIITATESYIIITFCGTQEAIDEERAIADVTNIDNDILPKDSEARFERDYPFGRLERRKRNLSDSRFDILLEEPFAGRRSLDVRDYHGKIRRFIESAKTGQERHLWTAIMVKSNDISPLKFVEYASLLMKHGYDVEKGQLTEFGQCNVLHK